MKDGGEENDDAEKQHDDAHAIVESHGEMDAGSRENLKDIDQTSACQQKTEPSPRKG